MALHKIRLDESITAHGSVTFEVEAFSAEAAAALVLVAYRAAATAGTNALHLPDGQVGLIDRDERVASTCSLYEVLADGTVSGPIEATEVTRSLN